LRQEGAEKDMIARNTQEGMLREIEGLKRQLMAGEQVRMQQKHTIDMMH
jgi:hypothetical protein